MAKKKSKIEKFTEEQPEVVEPSTEEVVEETITPPEEDIETFKGQLLQAFELNDKLLKEIDSRDRELSVFKEVRFGLESVIEQQNTEITKLKENVQSLKMEKFQERLLVLSNRWMRKYNLSEDKRPEVNIMLSKFQSEEELLRMETLLGLDSGSEKPNPTPLTQTSASLVEKFSKPSEKDVRSMSDDEKLSYFWKKMDALNMRFPR